MNEFVEGDVVIVGTGQAGTVVALGPQLSVLLANGDMWHGPANMTRLPQDQDDLDAAPREIDKFKNR